MKFYTIQREKHSIRGKNLQCFKITVCKCYKEGEEKDEIKIRIMERDITQEPILYISLVQIECTCIEYHHVINVWHVERCNILSYQYEFVFILIKKNT